MDIESHLTSYLQVNKANRLAVIPSSDTDLPQTSTEKDFSERCECMNSSIKSQHAQDCDLLVLCENAHWSAVWVIATKRV